MARVWRCVFSVNGARRVVAPLRRCVNAVALPRLFAVLRLCSSALKQFAVAVAAGNTKPPTLARAPGALVQYMSNRERSAW